MQTNRNTIRLYLRQIRQHKLSFIIAIITIPLSAILLDTLIPYFLSQAIGGLTTQNQDAITSNLILASIVGGIGILCNLVGFQALVRHEGRVRTKLYNSTFTALLGKDMRFFVDEKVGALTSRFIDFNRSWVHLQDLLIIRTLGFILTVGTGLTIVALSTPLLAGILLVLMAIIVLQVKFSTKIRAPYRHERKRLIAEIHGKIADTITNNLIVKTFATEKQEVKHIRHDTNRLEKIFIKDISIFSIDGTIRITLSTIVQLSAIAICTYLVFNDQIEISIAIFVLTYLQRISTQIFALGDMLHGFDEALLQAAPMSDILMQPTTVNDKPEAFTLDNITPTITFTNTSYRYDTANENVLQSINLSISAGEKIGLIGHSGAGKTTITHLLLRFSDVTGGSIAIDKYDIRDITQQSLRENIAYVPQEPMLFHRSLRENIAYGRPNATDAEIKQAAIQANAAEFIDNLPHKYDTMVGERGVKLSGGQRQRIAIARAILKDAPILILDEATSALDSESEKLIQDALEKLMKGRTSIVIAHRLSTIAKLDRIIVLDNGKIIEDGTHNQLLKNDGVYAKLWSHQSGGFIEE